MSAFRPEPPPRAILFDVGGTLIHIDADLVSGLLGAPGQGGLFRRCEPELRRAVNEFLAHPERHTEAPGTFEFICRKWCELAGTPFAVESLERARAENVRYSIWRERNRDADGVLEDLKRRGLRLGVVSNSDGRVARLLDDCGFGGLFETIIDSGAVGVAKPDPAIFRIALDALGEAPENVVYVGDIPVIDVVCAARAGLQPALYDPCDVYEAEAFRLESTLGRGIARLRSLRELLYP